MARNTRECFWFGTEEKMGWFTTPLQGADSSPSSWSVDGTLLNGGGWALNSWGSHKRYTYEWPQSSSPEVAQKMKSYRDGTYGRGLLYFLEPSIYRTNVLPAHWADPSMSIDSEAPSLVYGSKPLAVPTSSSNTLDLPVISAYYEVKTSPRETFSLEDSVFIPVPEGYTLHMGAFYSFVGSAGVFATPINANGTSGDTVKLTALDNSSDEIVADEFTNVRGIRLWVGRSDATVSTITITALIGRLVENGKPAPSQGPWVGGQGHSGCRFSGTPSYVTNSGVEGGRIGFAASFVEVGSWIYG